MKAFIQVFIAVFIFCSQNFAADKSKLPKKTLIACVGDSITYGFGIKNREKNSYPAQLSLVLGDDYYVENFGKNGATALKKGHAPYWKTPHYKKALLFKADLVIIKLGTNDGRVMNWSKHKDKYVNDYIALIKSFESLESKPKVLVCTSAPLFENDKARKKGFNTETIQKEVIPMIHKLAEKAGVELIDINSVLKGKKEMFPDGIHPNEAGARLIAETIAKAVKDKK